MTQARFAEIIGRFPGLRIAVVGDYSLDRYLEIDPARGEISIETGLPVFNVTRVRSQPGAAGTILNNLSALGIGKLFPVGFSGEDGEGWELRSRVGSMQGVDTHGFFSTPERHTFTYTKPLVCKAGKAPEELSRLDIKNWLPTPASVRSQILERTNEICAHCDALILLDQVDIPETGVIVGELLEYIRSSGMAKSRFVIGDSRRGLRGWPPIVFKMNAAELAKLSAASQGTSINAIKLQAQELASRNQQPVFVTLSERGIAGAAPRGAALHVPSLPVKGPIDIVGAGDAVTANLTAAMAAGANLQEAMELAMAAASVVVHQLGTTGTATVQQLGAQLSLSNQG